jgi:hypothetical protein
LAGKNSKHNEMEGKCRSKTDSLYSNKADRKGYKGDLEITIRDGRQQIKDGAAVVLRCYVVLGFL